MYGRTGSVHGLEALPAAALTFLRAMDIVRNRLAATAKLTSTELRAISRIAEAGRITPKELAASLQMTTGAVTAIANHLVALDLIHRAAHPTDRRSLLLELTPHADEVMKSIYADLQVTLTSAARSLQAEQRDGLVPSLVAISEELGAGPSAPLAESSRVLASGR